MKPLNFYYNCYYSFIYQENVQRSWYLVQVKDRAINPEVKDIGL